MTATDAPLEVSLTVDRALLEDASLMAAAWALLEQRLNEEALREGSDLSGRERVHIVVKPTDSWASLTLRLEPSR